jgi:FixJ family two-component response regulator
MNPFHIPCDATRRIAIVDDDPAVAKTLAAQVQKFGFESDLHLCAKTFLQTLDNAHYCAIMLDLSLPDTDGIELFDTFEAHHIDVPLILISGHSAAVMAAAKTIAQKKGLTIVATLTKPIRFLQLGRALGTLACHVGDTVQAS